MASINKIKCVVWDLDNTLWDGILVEDKEISIKYEVVKIIEELDKRGILQSIASKNDRENALAKLKEFGIEQYFLYPEISWNSKSTSINKIAKNINIGIDTIAFIDDQEFELDEVKFSIPEILCLNASEIDAILDRNEFIPKFITEDSAKRRLMYISDIKRKELENQFEGAKPEFLKSLNMVYRISKLTHEDLKRAEELTVRTHQLNTTGRTYSYEDLEQMINSDKYKLYTTSLEDKYGTYGKIGLSVIECNDDIWEIKLLLMSCRVMSRGVGNTLITYIMNEAKKANAKLRSEFISNDKNRIMYVTYKFAGFYELESNNDKIILQHDLCDIPKYAEYIEVVIE